MKGLFQIVGLSPDPVLPAMPGPFQIGSDQAPLVRFASLVKVTPRAAYYREALDQTKGKLGEFHPEQR